MSILPTLAIPGASLHPSIRAVTSLRMPNMRADDLELLYHYSDATSETFNTMPGIAGLKTFNVAQKVPEYPYLLHGLLAVSALHLQSTAADTTKHKRRIYAERATAHQQLALSSYISHLNSITDKTCHSIFMFSIVLTGINFASFHSQGPDEALNADAYLDRTISIFDLLLGAVAVANKASVWIPKFRSGPLLIPIEAGMHREVGSVDSEVQIALHELKSGLDLACTLELERNPEFAHIDISVVSNSVLPELHNLFRCLTRPEPDNFRAVIGWPAFVDKSYVGLLKQCHPAALVVLAYYGCALHALDNAWWLHGVGFGLVKSVAAIIRAKHEQEWQDLLRWPLQKIEQPLHEAIPTTVMQPSLLIDDAGCTPESSEPFRAAFKYTYANGLVDP